MGICDGEVGCEHGCGDFVAVGTIADEAVDETGTFGWLDGKEDEDGLIERLNVTSGFADLQMLAGRHRRNK